METPSTYRQSELARLAALEAELDRAWTSTNNLRELLTSIVEATEIHAAAEPTALRLSWEERHRSALDGLASDIAEARAEANRRIHHAIGGGS